MTDGPDDRDADLLDDDGQTEVIACPACGADVYAEADRCPRCGEWITSEAIGRAGPGRGRSRWWPWVVAALIALIVIVWVLGGWPLGGVAP